MADVNVTTTANFSDQIQRRLTDAERKPLRRFQTDALSYITSKWRGWKYSGRPQGAPRNVSLAKWKGKIQSTEADSIGMTISNAARSWDSGAPYVSAVERRRGDGSYSDRLIGDITRDLWPATVAEMAAAIVAELGRPSKPQKVRRTNSAAATVTAAPLIL